MSTSEYNIKELVRTSQARTPNAYISLASVGCEGSIRFGGISGQADSGAWLQQSLSVLVPLSTA